MLARLSGQLCDGLVRSERRGRTIAIKVRLDDWTTVTRARTIGEHTNDPERVAAIAVELLREYAPARPVRLLGVRASGFETTGRRRGGPGARRPDGARPVGWRAMPHAEVADRKVHYVRRGSGEPLLLIMGLSGNHLSWGEPFLEALARDFDVIAFDNRGIGLSDWASDPFTVADLAADAAGLLGRAGHRVRPRAGDLDGRDDRPGARARTSGARADADARLHVLRRAAGAPRVARDPPEAGRRA